MLKAMPMGGDGTNVYNVLVALPHCLFDLIEKARELYFAKIARV